MTPERYLVLVVEDEDEARSMVQEIPEDRKRILRHSAELCREKHPQRVKCECFPCTLVRLM